MTLQSATANNSPFHISSSLTISELADYSAILENMHIEAGYFKIDMSQTVEIDGAGVQFLYWLLREAKRHGAVPFLTGTKSEIIRTLQYFNFPAELIGGSDD